MTTILLDKALETLTSEERELIRELFYLGKTERQVSSGQVWMRWSGDFFLF